MSKEELKKLIPDTPKEWAFISMAISRLGTGMSTVLLFSMDKWWVLTSLLLTWLGYELAEYMKLQSDKPE